ncbi:hypothetical protein CH373_07860 [Leptospira perolatii]|uniref:TerC family protein n=1 Tax=Leptospira perolatii TaxID=2023191 RepID=A0A2M9ZNL1_9LEPT|nr:TerC family protein [Leptospira perolatii]PJZ68972.1 hypothetical protein CH360_13855 [Leptospira perolatii]PJZ73670.1 hypothetical protein CH373_07860 [Leptospira perolatii]
MDIATVDSLVALLTLTAMEIVLGIDNIVFLSIIVGKLPKENQAKGRSIGLILALGFRILLLLTVSWMASLTAGLFTVIEFTVTGRDLIMLGGGLFLLAKSTSEIHSKIEGPSEDESGGNSSKTSFASVVVQIVVLDIVFSVDSIVTAVGLSGNLMIMILAVVISLFIMLIFSGTVSDFINRHPTMKVLALSFLIMIGALLFADGLHFHIPKGYIYFAMAFSLAVEILNIKVRKTASSNFD